MKSKIKPEANYLFEASWEICNKVGGIHRVIESKASLISSYYRKNYFLIGPYFSDKAKGEFQEKVPTAGFKRIFGDLEKEGIKCHLGKWLIKGEPNVILIDFANFLSQANEIKKELWENYKIDSLKDDHNYTEPVVWSWAAGKLIERLVSFFKDKKSVAQFHEWLAGAGLLYLKKNNVDTGTVFTTHATTLGRTLAGNNIPLYSLLKKINPDEEARKFDIQAKHQLEKNIAEHCDIFTTVSEITGIEAEHLLGRKPDVLLPNGLDIAKFPTFEETIIKHRIQRSRMREFLLYYFFPYYTFDIKETLFYFIVGRYEFRNKGIDLFIKSLGKLNEKLKKEKSKKTIVAFFWVPAGNRGIKSETLESRETYRDIKDSLDEISDEMEENILYSITAGKKPQKIGLFGDKKEFLKIIKKKVIKLKREGLPPLSTHDLSNSDDIILKSFKKEGLENKKEDKVKVVFSPIYLSGSDGLLNLNYYESIQGSHLGIFPSFYEPWGYTPLETAALGVASITTDLSGFGKFFREYCQNKEKPGIFILKRHNEKDEKVVKSLTDIMRRFSRFSRQERVQNKIQARKIAAMADWEVLIENYIKAHNKAIEKNYD